MDTMNARWPCTEFKLCVMYTKAWLVEGIRAMLNCPGTDGIGETLYKRYPFPARTGREDSLSMDC